MDVQTESTDPPPGETQPSGKIRKGFKLFGKRKPGNIFSIRNKGDANNKSPVKTGKSLDGLSDTAAPDLEQDSDKEKGNEVSQGEREQAEEEPLGEDGVLAAAPARTSISSASSAKSLSFLSLLRGGRRGMGDRRAHTVSQPVGRQRRGLKGLFGNVKFKSKEKVDMEETPPSPLLMSSRANSVEIIKEDLTLTPKSQPRSLGSPVTEPIRSVTSLDSSATSPSDTVTPPAMAGNVSTTNEHVLPFPDSEPPLVPGDSSLSSLLADISSLLTFDSISGGDIMADVEKEWGKASSAISAVVTEVPSSSTSVFSKPSSPMTSTSVSSADKAKPTSPVASTRSSTPLTKTSITSSPAAKPSSIITTLTKTSTLTTTSVKLSSDLAPVTTAPLILSSFSTPKVSSPSITSKPTSTATTALSITTSSVAKAPSVSSTLTSTISKPASEIPAAVPTSVSKPSPVATPAPVKPPVTQSPPTLVSFTQPPPLKLDSTGGPNLKTSTFKPLLSSVPAESKAPAIESITKPSSSSPGVTTTVTTSTATSSSVSSTFSKPQITSSPLELYKTTFSPAAAPDHSSTFTSTTKPPPFPASIPAPSYDKLPPAYKPPPAPASFEKPPPPLTQTSAPIPSAGYSISSPTPPGPVPIPVTQSKGPSGPVIGSKEPLAPPGPAQVSLSKDPSSTDQIKVSVSKALSAPFPAEVSQPKAPSQAQFPTSVCKDAPANVKIPDSVVKEPPVTLPAPVSLTKDAPTPVQIIDSAPKVAPVQIPKDIPTTAPVPAMIVVSLPKVDPIPPQIPVSKPKEAPVPAQIPVSKPKDTPVPAQIPVSKPKDTPVPAQIPSPLPPSPPAPSHAPTSASKDAPAPTQIQLSHSKAPSAPTPAPCPVSSSSSSLSSPPSSWQSEPSFKTRGSEQATVDGKLTSPSSTDALRSQTAPDKTEEQQNESRAGLQVTPRETKIPQAKVSGLSKIPVVGGGRAGKIPVRDSQHMDEEPNRDPPTPVFEEERPNFNSCDAGSRDKIRDVEANVPTSKHSQEDSPPQKALTSLPRDSKLPVKHASQIPQAKETPRTKIPVSKVPVRRVGNKPAAGGSGIPIRK